MNESLVDRVATAVMYEGYILYPYRPSLKNRQRWTFGGVFPRDFAQRQCGSDRCFVQTECLISGSGAATLQIEVRFLHLMMRTAGRLASPLSRWPEGDEPPWQAAESLRVGDQWYPSWQEAVARKVTLPPLRLEQLVHSAHRERFTFSSRRDLEPLRASEQGSVEGVLVREQQPICGSVEVSAELVAEGLYRVSATTSNESELEQAEQKTRDEALMRALVATHAVLRVREGAFHSLIDPPDRWREAADQCHNVGAWPVLVGEEGARDAMLAAPIILYDYPQVAPESPGDFFDCTEIDELLTLRVQTLTDEEKTQMRAVDEQTRALLQRADGLSSDSMQGLHGAIRQFRPLSEER